MCCQRVAVSCSESSFVSRFHSGNLVTMGFRVAFYFAAFAVMLTHNIIIPVKGQPTVQACENGDSSVSIVEEIQQLRGEIFGDLNKLAQGIHELLKASFQQMKNQQDIVMSRLQAVDRRSQEQDVCIKQVQNIHELLNKSFQQMKNQNDTVMTSLLAIDQRSQEQSVFIMQVQSIHELFNASFEQMKNQHAAAIRRLDVVIQLLRYHDISITNQTENPWKLANGLPVQPEVDLGEGPVLLPIVNNWIIIMNRSDGSVNFNRTWTEYENGFGDIGRGEFWLGNEIVHRLTNTNGSVYTLRIEVQLNTSGRWFYADYSTFSLDSENNKYALLLSGFSGSAGDSLTNTSLSSSYYHGGMNFSTWQNNNDRCSTFNCANHYQAGWWFNCCYHSCLTCTYNGSDFQWSYSNDWQTSGILRAARMMIKST